MKHKSLTHRHAIAALLAAVASPAIAQNIEPVPQAPTATPPPVVAPPVATPPVTASPVPAPVAAPRVTPPPVVSVAEPEAEPRPATRAERPAPQRQRAAARPAAAPAAAPVPEAAAPTPVPVAAAPVATPLVEPAAEPVAPPEPAEPNPAQTETATATPWALIGAAALVLLAGLGFFLWRRRRKADELYYEETYEEQPVAAAYEEPAPTVAAAPEPTFRPQPVIVPAAVPAAMSPVSVASVDAAAATSATATASNTEVDNVSVGRPDCDDIAEMVATSDAPSGRPWIELLMRPIRAGTQDDDAVVEFELTVGNAGGVAAKDVRISSWMFAAGSPQESEMERMLIDPPAGATLAEQDINPGDGARIEAALALPANGASVLPVVVADARYTLPDGGEGRTSASFEIGLARDGGIEAFRVDDHSGLHDDIDARLHREPERV